MAQEKYTPKKVFLGANEIISLRRQNPHCLSEIRQINLNYFFQSYAFQASKGNSTIGRFLQNFQAEKLYYLLAILMIDSPPIGNEPAFLDTFARS